MATIGDCSVSQAGDGCERLILYQVALSHWHPFLMLREEKKNTTGKTWNITRTLRLFYLRPVMESRSNLATFLFNRAPFLFHSLQLLWPLMTAFALQGTTGVGMSYCEMLTIHGALTMIQIHQPDDRPTRHGRRPTHAPRSQLSALWSTTKV